VHSTLLSPIIVRMNNVVLVSRSSRSFSVLDDGTGIAK
jgi:hypothetical protein